VYVWADGVYLQARMEEAVECMLVLMGATPEGKKELVGFQTGVRESTQSWRELLVDIKQRGLEIAPDLAVGDGALGFWKAIEEAFPANRHQRCWVHKTANVLNKVALSVQVNMKADIREIYGAPTRAAAEATIDVFADKYSVKYDKAVACLTKDREKRCSPSSTSLPSAGIICVRSEREGRRTLTSSRPQGRGVYPSRCASPLIPLERDLLRALQDLVELTYRSVGVFLRLELDLGVFVGGSVDSADEFTDKRGDTGFRPVQKRSTLQELPWHCC
jgi:Transposase, Mutator family